MITERKSLPTNWLITCTIVFSVFIGMMLDRMIKNPILRGKEVKIFSLNGEVSKASVIETDSTINVYLK